MSAQDHRDLARHITAESMRPNPQALARFRARRFSRRFMAMLRDYADTMTFWRYCGRKACVRAQRCKSAEAICCGERFDLVDQIFLEPYVFGPARAQMEAERA